MPKVATNERKSSRLAATVLSDEADLRLRKVSAPSFSNAREGAIRSSRLSTSRQTRTAECRASVSPTELSTREVTPWILLRARWSMVEVLMPAAMSVAASPRAAVSSSDASPAEKAPPSSCGTFFRISRRVRL